MARGTKIARQLFVDHDSVTGDEDEEDDVPNSDDSDRLVISCQQFHGIFADMVPVI